MKDFQEITGLNEEVENGKFVSRIRGKTVHEVEGR